MTSEHINTKSIEAALEGTEVSDDDLRQALAAVQDSIRDYWGEWIALIGQGDVEVVAEDQDALVLADHTEYNWDEELAAEVDGTLLQRAVEQAHREEATRRTDFDFTGADPFVVAKSEPMEAGQMLVEAIVNSLIRRGLSPGQAWGYYGVEIRGNSRNQWASRCGYSDHSVVSEAVRKAKDKLER